MKKILTFFLFLLFIPIMIMGQGATTIKGKVTDSDGSPLPGANVVIKALNIGTATDINGNYTIDVPASMSHGQTVALTASFVGYKSVTVNVTLSGKTIEQNFTLQTDVFQSEQVVVTGIANKRSKGVAEVSVSRMNAVDYSATNSYQSFSQLIAGKVSGIQLTPTSGNAGAGFRFYVRAGGGINGNEQPVIYLDGVRLFDAELGAFGVGGQGISSLSSLNPDDIANIEVLKGPAAASTYGVNGSNGVVLITTKSGSAMPGGRGLSINYRYNYGFNEQSKKYSTDNFFSANDANSIFIKGYIREHSVDISGGGNQIRYYGSFTSRYEGGILPNTDLNRKSLKANISAFPSDKLTLRLNSTFNYNDINRPQNDNNILGFLGNTLLFPTSWQFTDSLAVRGLTDINREDQFIGNFQATYTPIENLELNASVGVDNSTSREDRTFPANLIYSGRTRGERDVYNNENKQFTYDLNAKYNYNITDELKATSIVGVQLFNRSFRSAFLGSQTFATELITNVGAGSTVNLYGEGFINTRDAGIFTDNSFSFQDRYFFTIGVREDFASSIGAEAPSVIYPHASAAVRLDRLGLVPNDFFSLFKLRAAYGETGQLPQPTDPIPLLWGATTGGYGGGATIVNIGNPAIKPERIKEFEVGFDAEFLNMFSLEFTYYRQNANNSIVGFNNAPTTGLTASSVPINVGSIKAWGFESLLQANLLRSADYSLDLSFIWNYQTNEVTSIGGAQPIFDGFNQNVIKEGLPKHEFYLIKVNGAKFDANGKYAGPDVTTDRFDFGNPIPNHTGSFTLNFRFFKNFNLYVLADWALKRKMINDTERFATRFGNNPEYQKLKNQLGLATGSQKDPNITPFNPGTPEYIAAANAYAKLDGNYPSNYVEDAQFFKLRELSISYSFRDLLVDFLGQYGVKDIVLGFSARNLFTITPYTGSDVELNSNGSRSLTRGWDFLTLQNPRVLNMWMRVSF
ncbi:TonB-dependent receptor domain-containing protein [Melioribacteraceae bacterium 4301-Me]|uniref:TonB-dependent receptor domain-containing protein n=1 Tax=Pyranulibacter aquaticus TaxID=3163344 RepID=UPI003597D2E5